MIVKLYQEGVDLSRPKGRILSACKNGATGQKRGSICGFSFSARLRLRLALLTSFIPGFQRFAITLTLPWVVDDWSVCMADFRRVLHCFRVYWVRAFPGCSAIFRVELQRRGAPHLHMIAFHPSGVGLPDKYFLLWFNALGRNLRGGSFSDFARFGVKVDLSPNGIAAVRYLCDHTSKKKQAQLGYQGKQWGILGRANLARITPDNLDLSDSETVRLLRLLRKITRFHLSRSARFPDGLPCPFGSKLVGGRSSSRVAYVSPGTILRFVEYLRREDLRRGVY